MTTTRESAIAENVTLAAAGEDGEGAARRSISARRVLLRDYWSFILVLLSAASLISLVGAPALLLLVPLTIRRANRVRGVLMHGKTTVGVVLHKRFLRGEWLLRYGFKAGAESVNARNFVLGFRLPVEKGDKAAVVYDPENPTSAYLPILYADPLPSADRA